MVKVMIIDFTVIVLRVVMNDETMDVSILEVSENINERSKIIKKIRKFFYHLVKRIFDFFCAILGIILMIPIMIIVKISYMITGDFHKIFYKQKRIGKNGKEIGIYKFRSMVPNAEEELKKLLKKKKYKKEWDLNQKLDNDPRITRIGNILRKTSLDELPQFINVLINDMSMIGPRPLVKGELDAHNGNHKLYESVKPGITGWWASHGRSTTTYEERLELEYYYVRNVSLWLDIKCIFATIGIVISKTGAK